MFVVTKVEYMRTNNDDRFVELANFNGPLSCTVYGQESPEGKHVKYESIEGRRFVNPRTGEDIVIGISADVRNLLGIEFEVIDGLKRSREEVQAVAEGWKKKYSEECSKITALERSFFRRLRFLFTGAAL